MDSTELGLYRFDELKEMWRKKYTNEEIRAKLQEEAERRCREVVEELDLIMRGYLIGDEGGLEDLVDSTLTIIEDEDIGIDWNNPCKILGEVIGWDDTMGKYLYMVKDKEGQEYIGGKVCICLDFEDANDQEEEWDVREETEEILRIIDVTVYYEEIDNKHIKLTK